MKSFASIVRLAQVGGQCFFRFLDSRLRGNDDENYGHFLKEQR